MFAGYPARRALPGDPEEDLATGPSAERHQGRGIAHVGFLVEGLQMGR